ncbi:hypothetical protein DHEL01_v204678 [Diaporthe helianthi]|uniref:Uncharacterized protein n=1 Tax=Diaporthe helianthi TaxID=158607 RepID=A0A2P5I363_DIAHE|nr:hypothetical protein DHEL01_v204678 [Diaporthe helianthi]
MPHGDLKPPQPRAGISSVDRGLRLSPPILVTLNEAWSMGRPATQAQGGSRGGPWWAMAGVGLSSGWRLGSCAVCSSCPSGWDGRDLTCTRSDECANRVWPSPARLHASRFTLHASRCYDAASVAAIAAVAAHAASSIASIEIQGR